MIGRTTAFYVIAIITAVAVIVGSAIILLPKDDKADDANITGDDTWSLEDGTLTISGNGMTADYSPLNPAPWGTGIVCVKVQEGVTGIGTSVFQGCQALTEVSLPASLSTVGASAFAGCYSLRTVTLPDAVKVLSEGVFSGCSNLERISIPGITEIGTRSFYGCSSLTDLVFPNTLTKIGDQALQGCPHLKSLSFPTSLSELHERFFGDCRFFGELGTTIPTSQEQFRGREFIGISDDYHRLGSQGDAKWYIVDGALFLNGSSMGDYSLESPAPWGTGFEQAFIYGVQRIGNYAFAGCESLYSIMFDSSVTSIGDHAFEGCTYAVFPEKTMSKIESVGEYAFRGCEKFDASMDSLTSVGKYAFYGCISLEGFTCGNLGTIPEYAYAGCVSIDNLYLFLIPSVTKIGERAFEGCSKLDAVILSDNVVSVGGYAFAGCEEALRYVYVGSGIEQIYDTSFGKMTFWVNDNPITNPMDMRGKNFVRNTEVDQRMDYYESSGDLEWFVDENVLYIYGQGDMGAYTQQEPQPWTGKKITKVFIDEGARCIGDYAFYGIPTISSVVIPETVTSIGTCAFSGCSALQSAPIGKVRDLGVAAFQGCVKLTDAPLCDTIASVPESLFEGCVSLRDAVIPATAGSIGARSFQGCTGLESVRISSATVDIASNAFDGNTFVDTMMNRIQDIGEIAGQSFIRIDNELCQISSDCLMSVADVNSFANRAFYTDGYFLDDQTRFSWSLADLSIALQNTANIRYLPPDHTDMSNADRYVRAFLLRIGFTAFQSNQDFTNVPGADTIGVATASKKLSDGSTLIAVAIRGGIYGAEWASNADIGTGKDTQEIHHGFYLSAQKAISFLNDYIKQNGISGDVKLWIAGFSRAGGVQNTIGGIVDKGIAEGKAVLEGVTLRLKDTYVYTFEAPRTTTEAGHADPQYGNIFNLVYAGDVVPLIPSKQWGFERFGVDKVFSVRSVEEGRYLVDMMKQSGYDDYRYGADDEDVAKHAQALMGSIAKHIKTRGDYVEQYQENIRYLQVALLYDKQGHTAAYNVMMGLGDKMWDLILQNHDKRVEIVLEYAEKEFAEYGIDKNAAPVFSELTVTLLEDVLGGAGISTLLYIINTKNTSYMMSFHISYLASFQVNWNDEKIIPKQRGGARPRPRGFRNPSS